MLLIEWQGPEVGHATMKASANSFGTFLETVQKRRASSLGSGRAATRLIQMVADGDDTVPALMARSGMDVQAFMTAFSDLTEMGLIELGGPPGQERATLTPAGKEVAALTPPAD
jgi:hypothetical protein